MILNLPKSILLIYKMLQLYFYIWTHKLYSCPFLTIHKKLTNLLFSVIFSNIFSSVFFTVSQATKVHLKNKHQHAAAESIILVYSVTVAHHASVMCEMWSVFMSDICYIICLTLNAHSSLSWLYFIVEVTIVFCIFRLEDTILITFS